MKLIDADALKTNLAFSFSTFEDGIMMVPYKDIIRDIDDANEYDSTQVSIKDTLNKLEESIMSLTINLQRYGSIGELKNFVEGFEECQVQVLRLIERLQ